MKFYLAPLEGITNLYYRKEHNKFFNGIDKYFIPFLNPAHFSLSTKDLREMKKENNELNAIVIPQIISKNSKETLWLIDELQKLGYSEVNLNLGCPSKVVINKGKGSGMLKDLKLLDSYLNEVFSSSSLPISIKLRLGLEDINEFNEIIKVLNKYPVSELIVHLRTAKETYIGPVHLELLNSIHEKTNFDIIYNGEIRTKDDIDFISSSFPFLKGIMIGRGLITCPDLLDNNEKSKDTIIEFYYDLYSIYLSQFRWNNTKYFLKEIWVQLINHFDIPKSLKKDLFKCEKEDAFNKIVTEIFTYPLIAPNSFLKDHDYY